MNPLARAIMGRAGAGGGPPAWTPASLASRILHLDAGVGVTLSGTTVTAWADQSGAGRTITISGTPQHSAADANLGGRPSITTPSGSRITADIPSRASIAFAAAVIYADAHTIDRFAWDGFDSTRRVNARCNADAVAYAFNSTIVLATGIYSAAGIRRLLVPYDGATASVIDGVTRGVAPSSGTSTGSGVTVGSSYSSAQNASLAEIVMCSAVPSSGDIASLVAYYASRYP